MKTTLAEKWSPIRFVIYGVLMVAAGGLWLAGWITSEQANGWLENAENLLFAAGFMLAGKYVPRTEPKPEPEPVLDVSVAIDDIRRRAAGVVVDVLDDLPESVDDLRRRLGR